MPSCALMRYYQSFPSAIPLYGVGCPRVTHPSATQSSHHFGRILCSKSFVRLACVRHAASVHPEPGSNSHFKFFPFSRPYWSFVRLYLVRSSERFPRNLFRVASLFSCQGSARARAPSALFARANVSISSPFPDCKHFLHFFYLFFRHEKKRKI